MKAISTSVRLNFSLFMGFILIFGIAFSKVFLKVQTTLLGYKIGQEKMLEEKLLQERSELQMHLAKITTRDHLRLLIQNAQHQISAKDPSVAEQRKHDSENANSSGKVD